MMLACNRKERTEQSTGCQDTSNSISVKPARTVYRQVSQSSRGVPSRPALFDQHVRQYRDQTGLHKLSSVTGLSTAQARRRRRKKRQITSDRKKDKTLTCTGTQRQRQRILCFAHWTSRAHTIGPEPPLVIPGDRIWLPRSEIEYGDYRPTYAFVLVCSMLLQFVHELGR